MDQKDFAYKHTREKTQQPKNNQMASFAAAQCTSSYIAYWVMMNNVSANVYDITFKTAICHSG